MEQVTSVNHEIFQSMICFNYSYPVTTHYEYQSIYNRALDYNFEIIAILHDGIVYKNNIQNI